MWGKGWNVKQRPLVIFIIDVDKLEIMYVVLSLFIFLTLFNIVKRSVTGFDVGRLIKSCLKLSLLILLLLINESLM